MSFNNWPAFVNFDMPDFDTIEYEHGVWGKAHGARTDYRWLALTPDADFKKNEIDYELSLGNESLPRLGFFWKYLNNKHYAVMTYPSRAEDADGRRDFLEKQILCLKSPNFPAPLTAMLLFTKLFKYDESVWWEQRQSIDWDNEPDAFIELPSRQSSISTTGIIEKSFEQLRDYFGDKETLAQFYSNFIYSDATVPLPPLALAALLLPFPKNRAEELSIAGWFPSSTIKPEHFKKWDMLVLPSDLSVTSRLQEPRGIPMSVAESYATAIFDNNPDILKEDVTQQIQPIQANTITPTPNKIKIQGEGEISFPELPEDYRELKYIEELRNFAMNPNRRWLDAYNWKLSAEEPFPYQSSLDTVNSLMEMVKLLERDTPKYTLEFLQDAVKKQWEVKIRLLKTAIFIISPYKETYDALGFDIKNIKNELEYIKQLQPNKQYFRKQERILKLFYY